MITGKYAWVDGKFDLQFEGQDVWFFMVTIWSPKETYVEYRSLLFQEIEMLVRSFGGPDEDWDSDADDLSFTFGFKNEKLLNHVVAAMPTDGEGEGLFFNNGEDKPNA